MNSIFIVIAIIACMGLYCLVSKIQYRKYGIFLSERAYLLDREVQFRPTFVDGLKSYVRITIPSELSDRERKYVGEIATYFRADLEINNNSFDGYGNEFCFVFDRVYAAKDALDFFEKNCRK